MRNFVSFIALTLLIAPLTSFARDTSDGCGLGWEITDKKTLSATTTRATTNAFVPPTFGMTTGSIGCEQHSIAKTEVEQIYYANANFENLAVEMSEGQGEYLTSFANVLGCQDATAFGKAMQANYSEVMGENGAQLLANTKKVLRTENLNCSVN